MANFFTRALDKVTPWRRGGEVQRDLQAKKKKKDEEYSAPQSPGGLQVRPIQQNQNITVQSQPQAQRPENLFEDLNKNLMLGQNKPGVVPVFNNPNNQPIQTPTPGTVIKPAAQPTVNTHRNLFQKALDQVNPLDSGRTFKSAAPTNTRSVIGQASHNMVTNIAGDMVAKPFVINPAQNVIETGRAITAEATHNLPALKASQEREAKNVKASLPHAILAPLFYGGKANTVDLFKQAVADATGNKVASKNAGDAYMKDINKTPVGGLLNILQRKLANFQVNRDMKNLTPEERKQLADYNLAKIGIDPTASGVNQAVQTGGSAIQLAAPTFGLAKAGIEGTTAGEYLRGATFVDMAKNGAKVFNRNPSVPETGAPINARIPSNEINPSQKPTGLPQLVQPEIPQGSPSVLRDQPQPKTQSSPQLSGQSPIAQPRSAFSSDPVIPQVANDVNNILSGQKINERGFAKTVRESGKTPKIDAIDNNTYVVKSDKQRIADAREYIQTDPVRAEQVALNPQNDIHVTIGNQLLDHYIATGQLDKFRTLNSGMADSGTEMGRAIHAFADYNKTTPSGAVKFAESTVRQYNKLNPSKKLNLSNEDINGLVTRAQDIQKMTAGKERSLAEGQLTEQINNLIPSTIADKAITVWKAGLLTSPRTTMRNIVGNTVHGVAEIVKDIPASLNDILLKQRTGERSLTFTTRGELGGALKGLGTGKDMMKYGFDPSNAISKYDVNHVTWGEGHIQQALKHYTDFVFRTMGAQDQPFYHASFARSLYDQAGALAKNAGKSGDRNFIQDLVDNPNEQMVVNATKDATTATFHNKNALNDVASKFKQTLGKTQTGKVISEVVAPFTGVPSSIAGQIMAYSPVGLVKGIAKDVKVLAKNMPELQRQASQEIGRGIVGTGLLSIGAYLTAQGLMTGNPKDANEARQWELEGKQPNSVFINGKWRSINSVGPEALVVLAGSKIQSGVANKEGAGSIAGNIGKDFTQQTFLQGVQGPLNAITDPQRYGSTYIKGQAASVIPNVVKDSAKAFDPFQRETNSPGDALKAGIPGLRNNLLPKRDALGNPLKQEPSGAGAFVDLFNSKTPIKNDVVDELSRLYKADQSATPSKLNKGQTILGQKVQFTPQELDQLEQDTGQPIREQFSELMGTSEYQGASDEIKKKALDNIVEQVRGQAKLDIAQGSTGSDVSNKIDVTKLTKDAQLTLAKDSFNKSGKNYQVVGDTVLRRSADGTITATPKVKFDYQVGTATLTKQKNADDLDGWLKTAQGQLDSIDKQLQDPAIDPLDALTLQNDAQALVNNMAKYKDYGGFTKPKGYGASPKALDTSFGTLKAGQFAPQVQQYQTIDAKSGVIPHIAVQRPNIVHRIGTG